MNRPGGALGRFYLAILESIDRDIAQGLARDVQSPSLIITDRQLPP